MRPPLPICSMALSATIAVTAFAASANHAAGSPDPLGYSTADGITHPRFSLEAALAWGFPGMMLQPEVDPPAAGGESSSAPPQPTAPAQPATPATPVNPPNADRSAANNPLDNEITPELDAAVSKGLAYLARRQAPDGCFGDASFGRGVAITALSCIALMADGNVPGRGAYADNVARGLTYILANCNDSGLIASDQANSPMYGHGFAALFLGEVYGMTQGGGDTALAERVHKSLLKAIHLIESTQNDEGGWRYNPVAFDADISVTISQIMALRSARNAGLEVPKATIDKAVEYVRACQNPDGGFRYMSMAGPSAFPRSAAGIASLFYAGIYDDPRIDRGIRYLNNNNIGGPTDNMAVHYYYGQYYAVQAMFLAGGDAWARWWPDVRATLLKAQRPPGNWDDLSVSTEYGTAMSLIILQMPKRYLPIFQK